MFHPPVISTGETQRFFVVDQLESIHVEAAAILLEPAPRNTAPAIAAAAFWALNSGNDDPLLVMPSDHLIEDVAGLRAAIDAALPAALEGKLLTFGIKPTRPHTGYGYIHSTGEGDGVSDVESFVEKPDAELAAKFVEDGSYYWNSGIFLFGQAPLSASSSSMRPKSRRRSNKRWPERRPTAGSFGPTRPRSIRHRTYRSTTR